MKRLQLFMLMLMALSIRMLAAGTTWEEATQLPLGQEKSSSLSKDITEEWWKFTITADGAATITVTPSSGLRISDVRLYYYEYNNNQIINFWQRSSSTYWMNPGWNSGSFTTPNLAPGTYLLRVQRGEGEASYTIKCDFTANSYTKDKEPDDWNNTSVLPLNTPIQGHLGYGYQQSGEDNHDWWTFEVTSDGQANINIKHEGTLRISDLRLYFFEYDDQDQATNYWQRSSSTFWINPGWEEGDLTTPNLAPGKYLIRVERGEGHGGYELTYTFTPNPYTKDMEPNDWNKTSVLPLNKPVQGHLGYGYQQAGEDDHDWWTFEVTKDGAATIAISHDESLRISDVRLYYYEYDDQNQATNYWQRSSQTYWFNPGWKPGDMRIPNLAPGKYLIRVERGEGYGGYELSYTIEPQMYKNDPEPNNNWNEGRDNNYLARGQEKQGHLGYGYQQASEDDCDWYRIKVPCDGKVNLTYTPTNVNSALRVSDIRLYFMKDDNYWQRSSNTFWMNPGLDAGTLTIPDMAVGEYLVRVERGEGYGAYSLKYEFKQNELPNDTEPNNEWNQPSKLVEGKTQSGHLGYGYENGNEDTYDWYEITMAKSGTLKINIQPGSGLRISDVRLYYYSDDKSNYWQRSKGNYWVNPGWDAATLTTTDVEAGDYLIRVQRGEGCGNYRISFNADLTDVDPVNPLPDEPVDDPDNPDNPDDPDNPDNPDIDISGPNKDFIDDVGKDLLDQWDADSYRNVLGLLQQSMSYDTKEISEWGAEALKAMKTAITTPYNGISNGYMLMVRAATFTGHFRAVNNHWKYEGPADDLQFIFADQAGTPCVARIVTSGDSKTVKIPYEFDEDEDDEDSGLFNIGGVDELTKDVKLIAIEVPEHFEISFTHGSTQLMLTTVDFDLSCFTEDWNPTTNGLIVSINSTFAKSGATTRAEAGTFEMSMNRVGYMPGTGINFSFTAKNDGKQIIALDLKAPGTLNLEDGIIDIDPETGVTFKNIGIKSVNLDLDVMGRIQAHGSISDVTTFVNTLSSASNCKDGAEAQQIMSKLDDLMDGSFYYDNGTEAQGSLGLDLVYNEEKEEWTLEPIISFTSDNSSYPITTYFSEKNFPEFVGGVQTILNELREVATTLIQNVEKMEEEAAGIKNLPMAESSDAKAKIYTIGGRAVTSSSTLPSGVYIIKTSAGTRKFIKK